MKENQAPVKRRPGRPPGRPRKEKPILDENAIDEKPAKKKMGWPKGVKRGPRNKTVKRFGRSPKASNCLNHL